MKVNLTIQTAEHGGLSVIQHGTDGDILLISSDDSDGASAKLAGWIRREFGEFDPPQRVLSSDVGILDFPKFVRRLTGRNAA